MTLLVSTKRTLTISAGFFFFIFLTLLNSTKVIAQDLAITEKTPQLFALGDLVFRSGTGYESYFIKRLSGSHLSHIGVITEIAPIIKITHAITDDKPEQANQVIESTLDEFTHTTLANSWVVYRMSNLAELEKTHLVTALKSQLGKPFILAIRNEPHRYCTTIIEAALPAKIQTQLIWQEADFVGFHGSMLYPNAFLKLEGLELIYSSDKRF